jgi:hypothetical protein
MEFYFEILMPMAYPISLNSSLDQIPPSPIAMAMECEMALNTNFFQNPAKIPIVQWQEPKLFFHVIHFDKQDFRTALFTAISTEIL